MSTEGSFPLDVVRADGWFERVVTSVPALGRLCDGLGEALVALSLVAGFRIVSAGIDRVSGEVTTLQWVRDSDGGGETTDSGPPDALRSEVMAALLGDADVVTELSADPDMNELRQCIGPRYVLLAPLFGLTLEKLMARPGTPDEPRLVVVHERGQETVGLRQFRRFLRSRVIDVLQQSRNRSVAIDLEQIDVARAAFDAGRYDEVVGRLGGWVSPLLMYLRTPEGASLDARTRSELGRALGLLGESLHHLGRTEEGEETLRLGVQYAQEGAAAAELYRTLARLLIAENRRPESIGLIRRSLTLEPTAREMLPDLALGFIASGKLVAAIGVLREMRGEAPSDRVQQVEESLRERLGDRLARYNMLVERASLDETLRTNANNPDRTG